MVTVTNYHLRESKEKKSFVTLELQGDLELVQSMNTGKFYATTRKCSIPCTFDETIAKHLVGKQMEGSIQRIACDPYDYTIEKTGEVIKMAHTYGYIPEGHKKNEQVLA